jgi:hypothetical protein
LNFCTDFTEILIYLFFYGIAHGSYDFLQKQKFLPKVFTKSFYQEFLSKVFYQNHGLSEFTSR